MVEQYFTESPNTRYDLRAIDYHLAGVDLKLTTGTGVLSRSRVDYGGDVSIRNILKENPVSGNILDVGCGYGPTGLFVIKKWPNRQVDTVDASERATDLARKNVEVNGATNVNIFASSVCENVSKQYAMILTNPPIRASKNTVNEILEKSYEHLLAGGELLTVTQKKQGAPNAKKLMETAFGNCEIVERDEEHYISRSVK